MSCITLRCITGKVFAQIPWKATQNKAKMIAYRGYVTLWRRQSVWPFQKRQSVWSKSYMTMGYKNAFLLIFDISYVALKTVTYVMSYTRYASLVKFLLRFELIKAHLSSFRVFSTNLDFLIWAHLGLFWAHIGSFWIYFGSYELI